MILSVASAKGGCGKSSLAILIGAELAAYGYRSVLLDCDINQHASAFGEKADIERFKVIPDVTEATILPTLRTAEAENDAVLIDLPGGTSALGLKAISRSSFVLIPCQPSLPDVRDAFKTFAQVDDAEELSRAKIARALIWTRVLPGFESIAARHVRQTVEGKGLPVFKAALKERAAFRLPHMTGKTPRQVDPNSAATANVAEIAAELLGNLKTLAQAA
jgi:chromosome partitioning protein